MMETFPSEAALRCRLGVTRRTFCCWVLFWRVPRLSGDWVVCGVQDF